MDFIEALAEHGLHPSSVLQDGRMHRFDTEKKGKKNGWYILYPEGYGAFGDWGMGLKRGFSDKGHREFTEEDRRKQREERQRRILEKLELQHLAAIKAQAMWASGIEEPKDHPYLTRKNIGAYKIRMLGGNLLIPMGDDTGTLVNVQTIPHSGTPKLFQKEAKVYGCYHSFGSGGNIIYICEGYATAAEVYEAMGGNVVVAFTASNLAPVTEVMRRKYPDHKIKVIADNDQGKKKHDGTEFNPGIEAAQKASEYGADIIIPQFTLEEGIDKKYSDFNDYAKAHGKDAVRQALTEKPAIRGIDYRGMLPNCKDGGKPMATVENLNEICKRLGYSLRYNNISHKKEISVPGLEAISDEFDNAAYGTLQSECAKFQYPLGQLDSFINVLAAKNAYNPIVNWILSKPWDGIERKEEFFNTVKARNEKLKNTLIYKWALQAIAAAFTPDGIAAQGVLVFMGRQDLGKTSWLLSLLPPDMSIYAKDGAILRLDDKDSLLQAICYWLVELGELEATFKRSDIAQLKAFLTQKKDVVRTPYAKGASEYPRRTVFFASVNHKEFLHDTTGNRRFWTVEALEINSRHGIDMQQLWREIYEDWREGHTYHLNQEEKDMLNENNESYESGDPIHDRISIAYNWDDMFIAKDWKTATQICDDIGIKNPTQADTRKTAAFIRKLNKDDQEKEKRDRKGQFFLMPSLKYGSADGQGYHT